MTHSSLLTLKDIFQLLMPAKNAIESIQNNWQISEKEKVLLLSRSAWSMALISLLKQQQEARQEISFWVPDYFCSSSLNIVRKTGCKVYHYPVASNMEPDFTACRELTKTIGKPDVFLLVHYFGKPNAALGKSFDFCKNNHAWLVEDAAHVLRPVKGIGDSGDFIMYSPHKLLPVPDGAILSGNSKGPSGLDIDFLTKHLTVESTLAFFKKIKTGINGYTEKPSILNQLIWLVKRILQSAGIRRFSPVVFFQQNISEELYTNCPLISPFSANLLSFYHKKRMDGVVLRRERNTLLWDEIIQKLSAKEKLKLSVAERPLFHDWCPYLAAYHFEPYAAPEKVFERLNTKDFFASTWPDVPGEVIRNPDLHAGAVSLRNFRMYLPAHQSVPVRHLRKLIRDIHIKDAGSQLPVLDVKSNHINQASWQSWIKTAAYPMSMLQDWQYGYAKQITEGWLLDRRVYSFQGKPVAIAQFLVKRLFGIIKIYRINRGPVFLSDDKKLTEAVISSIAGMGNIRKGQILMASFNLERNPSNTALLQRHGFITIKLTPYISSYIDLSASEQTLRSKLAGKWRNMLVYAEKRDIVITTAFDRESIVWMSTIHEKNMSEKKFQGIQPSLLKAYTGTGNAGVYKAVLDDQVIGAVCVACHGNTCTYLIGWTNEAGRSNKANYLLLWKAILDSKLRGYRFFDSGGIDRFSTEGIANFKLGLNGQPYALIPTGLKF